MSGTGQMSAIKISFTGAAAHSTMPSPVCSREFISVSPNIFIAQDIPVKSDAS